MSNDVVLEKSKLIIKAESVGDSNNDITLQVECVIPYMKVCFNLCRHYDKPYLIIERSRDLAQILEKNKDIVINKKTNETQPRNFDLPAEKTKDKDGEELEKPYQPGPIRDCTEHDHLDTDGCDVVRVFESEVEDELGTDTNNITCQFIEITRKV